MITPTPVKTPQEIDELNRAAYERFYDNPQAMAELARQAVHEARSVEYPEGEGIALRHLGVALAQSGQLEAGMGSLREAARRFEQIGDQAGEIATQAAIGGLYYKMRHYDTALEWQLKTLPQARELGLELERANILNSVANIYVETGEYLWAWTYAQQLARLCEANEDCNGRIQAAITLGRAIQGLQRLDEAEGYFQDALHRARSAGNTGLEGLALNMLGNNDRLQGAPERALTSLQTALGLNRTYGDPQLVVANLHDLAQVALTLGHTEELRQYAAEAIELAQSIESPASEAQLYKLLSEMYQAQGEHAAALTAYQQYHELEKQALRNENAQSLEAVQARLNAERNEQQKEIYRLKNVELEAALEHIRDSINYAGLLQTAVLPPPDRLTEMVPGSFVLYQPREEVGGDFYWIREKNGRLYLAAFDCTGHGIPGAMLSMLGVTILNGLASEFVPDDPAAALDAMDQQVTAVLANRQHTDDGMEGVLLSMDLATGQGYYAAAGSLGLLVHDSGSQELAYDPRAIGSLRRKGRRESLSAAFTSRPLDMSHGERLFLFSDGFKDQLGRRTRQSERVRKYGKLRFQQLLRKVAFQSPEQARAHLQQELADWKGPRQQVDDVMVLGLRLT